MSSENHQQDLVKSLQALRKDEHFCDVTLVCEDHQIETHKFLLSMCSPFFEKILKANKHPHPLLYLKDIKVSQMESLLDFMYSGKVEVEKRSLGDFLKVAGELKVQGLVRDLQFMDKNPENDESRTNEEREKTKLSGSLAEGVKSAADDESMVNEDVYQLLTTPA